jgi:hypothetical protein
MKVAIYSEEVEKVSSSCGKTNLKPDKIQLIQNYQTLNAKNNRPNNLSLKDDQMLVKSLSQPAATQERNKFIRNEDSKTLNQFSNTHKHIIISNIDKKDIANVINEENSSINKENVSNSSNNNSSNQMNGKNKGKLKLKINKEKVLKKLKEKKVTIEANFLNNAVNTGKIKRMQSKENSNKDINIYHNKERGYSMDPSSTHSKFSYIPSTITNKKSKDKVKSENFFSPSAMTQKAEFGLNPNATGRNTSKANKFNRGHSGVNKYKLSSAVSLAGFQNGSNKQGISGINSNIEMLNHDLLRSSTSKFKTIEVSEGLSYAKSPVIISSKLGNKLHVKTKSTNV